MAEHKPARYLLNAPVLTAYGQYDFEGPLSDGRANEIAAQGVTSAVGHRATANLLSRLLGMDVPLNRTVIRMAPGDQALVFRLLDRIPEGVVLDDDELARLPHEFGLLKRRS